MWELFVTNVARLILKLTTGYMERQKRLENHFMIKGVKIAREKEQVLGGKRIQKNQKSPQENHPFY